MGKDVFYRLKNRETVGWRMILWHVACRFTGITTLNPGECQSSNFDAQIADTTVSMIAYILLSFRYRYDNYESMGALFRSMNADRIRQTLDIRLLLDGKAGAVQERNPNETF
jgi:hypothetical protein